MPGNPFEDADDVRAPSSWSSTNYNTNVPNQSSGIIRSEIFDSHARAHASQQRALASIASSEQIGSETAAELLDQGEKLSRAEQRLDDIAHMQKHSQQQISTLSSVFGGFKRLFTRHSSDVRMNAHRGDNSVSHQRSSSLQAVMQKPSWSDQVTPTSSQFAGLNQTAGPQTTVAATTSSSDFEQNLTLMSAGVARLKSLAGGMHEELCKQNEQLDRTIPRVDSINTTMAKQNQQMNKLLGVKPK